MEYLWNEDLNQELKKMKVFICAIFLLSALRVGSYADAVAEPYPISILEGAYKTTAQVKARNKEKETSLVAKNRLKFDMKGFLRDLNA